MAAQAGLPWSLALGTAGCKAAYRFLAHTDVTASALLQAHRARTLDRIRRHGCVLLIQDTTSLDFSTHRTTTGLGPLAYPACQGLHVHTTLAATAEGVPLGILDQQVWARDPAAHGQGTTRRTRPTAAKESQRWLDALTRSHRELSPTLTTVTIADREADLYPLLALPRPPQAHLLLRAIQNRVIREEAGHLWDAIRQAPLGGSLHVAVPRRPQQPPREAALAVRWTTVTLCPPHHAPGAGVSVQALLAEEVDPPAGVTPICWLLLTTLPIPDLAAAADLVAWYTQRWLIERYHYVLKSGVGLERLQCDTAAALTTALGLCAIIAWRVLALTLQARQTPEAAPDGLFSATELQVLQALHPRELPPGRAPTLRGTIRAVARLGGFLGRTADGEPGVKTLWQGLRRLDDLVQGFHLAQQSQPPQA